MHLSHISFDILTFRKLFVRCDHRHNSSETRTICPNIHRQCRFDTNTFRTSLNESSSHILHFSSHAFAATAAFTTFPPLLVLFSFSFSFFIRFVYKFEHELFIWIAKKKWKPPNEMERMNNNKNNDNKKEAKKVNMKRIFSMENDVEHHKWWKTGRKYIFRCEAFLQHFFPILFCCFSICVFVSWIAAK